MKEHKLFIKSETLRKYGFSSIEIKETLLSLLTLNHLLSFYESSTLDDLKILLELDKQNNFFIGDRNAFEIKAFRTWKKNASIISIYKQYNSEEYHEEVIEILTELWEMFNTLENKEEYFRGILLFYSSYIERNPSEHLLPEKVLVFIASILELKSGETVYDPICGSGSLLVAASKPRKEKNSFLGNEVNSNTSKIAALYGLINSVENYSIERRDFLSTSIDQKFDVILSNPPYSLKNWENETHYSRDIFKYGKPPVSNADFVFLQKIIACLKREGRAIIIVPDGLLFRRGIEGNIRKNIILDSVIESIIKLPENIFTNTSVSVNILVINRSKNHESILFFDASRLTSTGENENLNKLVETYLNKKEVPSISRHVSLQEIKDQDFILLPNRYLSKIDSIKPDPIKLVELIKTQEQLEIQLTNLQNNNSHLLSQLKL